MPILFINRTKATACRQILFELRPWIQLFVCFQRRELLVFGPKFPKFLAFFFLLFFFDLVRAYHWNTTFRFGVAVLSRHDYERWEPSWDIRCFAINLPPQTEHSFLDCALVESCRLGLHLLFSPWVNKIQRHRFRPRPQTPGHSFFVDRLTESCGSGLGEVREGI